MSERGIRVQLSTAERLLYEVIRNGCISVKMKQDGELNVQVDSPPDYLVPRRIRQINVQEALKQLVDGRLWYLWDNSQLYILEPPKVKIMPLTLKAERFTERGVLVVSVDGVDYTGYKEIAKAVFGGYNKELLSELGPHLRCSFDLEEVTFVKMRKTKGRAYPVYRWRGYDFGGISNVAKKMFWLTSDDLDKLKKLSEENRASLRERRSDQLVRLFDISKEAEGYAVTNPSDQKEELIFSSKKKLLEYIREHDMGGSVSRETSRQIFDTIEGEVKWE